MTAYRQIHPFPARMAPELALSAFKGLGAASTVVDIMCGSGTVLRLGTEAGHHVHGLDLDPLAVLVSRVTCRRLHADSVITQAEEVVRAASRRDVPSTPWMDSETRDFTRFWFAPTQRYQLGLLADELHGRQGPVANALRVALSRTIITKNSGASLARDVSHSRPHRVWTANDYDVFAGFQAAAKAIAKLLDRPAPGRSSVQLGDARDLPRRLVGQADLVITSPPYLNAIDYMRGHRMSLVWLGHTLDALRTIRSTSVGAERAPNPTRDGDAITATPIEGLTDRQNAMFLRYCGDIAKVMRGVRRTLKDSGRAVLVVGNSTLNGVYVENSKVVEQAGIAAGLKVTGRRTRALPDSSRYLPPPRKPSGDSMAKRMRSEVVLTFNVA